MRSVAIVPFLLLTTACEKIPQTWTRAQIEQIAADAAGDSVPADLIDENPQLAQLEDRLATVETSLAEAQSSLEEAETKIRSLESDKDDLERQVRDLDLRVSY